jgi:hypothetical protein
MKRMVNKISASLVCSLLFAVIFIGVGTLLSMLFFGMDFDEKLLSAYTLTEKWRQGISFYLSAMLSIFVLLLICNHRKLFNSSYRLMAIGGLGGVFMLPLTVVVSYLLSGFVISFETIFVIIMLPLLLRVFLVIPLLVALLSGIISGLLYYGYRKLLYPSLSTPLSELTPSEISS